MRVLSNIGERTVRLADNWLHRLGDGEAVGLRDAARFRRLVVLGFATLVIAPIMLAMFISPVLALPVGATLALCVFLLSIAFFCALPRETVAVAVVQPEEAAFDACPGLAMLVDPNGHVIKVGGRDRQAFPGVLREAQGQSMAEIVYVSDRIALVQRFDALRQGGAVSSADVRVERRLSPAGRQFMAVRFDMTPVRDDNGDLVHVFVQARDICEERELREKLATALAEACSANEAKARFLAAVSHELRTPLNAILGFSDVLAGEYFGKLENDRQREYVGLIRQSGGHLLSVVNTMLDMSKIETGRYQLLTEPFVLGEALEACRAMLDLSAREKGLTLTSRVARGLGEVVADRRAIQQILINLASNAIKFTDAGGAVTMDAMRVGDDLVITVGDTGIGIAAEKLESIGQPFMQVDNAYTRSHEGTGLGLSLVKGLVDLHGGRFKIVSRMGEGTVVTITMPADGSGVASGNDEMQGESAEFPPRLKLPAKPSIVPAIAPVIAPAAQVRQKDEQDSIDATAKAKIA